MTSLTRLVAIDFPIIQAPMAGSQGSALAIAVCNAGGLGSLPCALLMPDAIRDELRKMTQGTTRPFNVNFFCHEQPAQDPEVERRWRGALAPYYKEYGLDADDIAAGPGRMPFGHEAAELLDEFRPAVVSFHFGLPSHELLQRARGCGARILSTATTVAEAVWLEQRGVDWIVAQGLEAGGHRGHFLSHDLNLQMNCFDLLARVLDAVRVPVIAAGGIASAADVARARQLGAAGVQVGTAYLLSHEATTSAVHRAAIASDAVRRTALTNLFTGRPARGIVNRLMRELGPVSALAPPFPLATAAIAPLRARAERDGKGDFSPLWCGQQSGSCRVAPAAEITRDLVRDLPAPS